MSKIDTSLWKKFKVKDIFDILSTNGIFHAVNVDVLDKQIPSSHPYIVRTSQNNGIKGFLIKDKKALNPANTISFAQDTAQIFYQPEPYFTGNKMKVFKLKGYEMTEGLALYLIACLNKAFSLFSWGQSFDSKILADVEIELPVTTEDVPDWDYMQEYIAELEQERIAELEHYLIAAGLNDYTLTDEDEQLLSLFRGEEATDGRT